MGRVEWAEYLCADRSALTRELAKMQDQLTGALVGLARATENNDHLLSDSTVSVVVESLFTTLTNVNFDNERFQHLLDRVDAEKRKLVPECFTCTSQCGRNYYTEFVRKTPADTVVLTLACGKYRFNDLDLGTIGGLPRLMDIGQCNDAYSAIQIAVALADAFGCGVNELPLSMVLSWYEQKAVCILLTLLHLGIRNICLGPTLPAFISPNVLNYLVERSSIAPISTLEEDLAAILGTEHSY